MSWAACGTVSARGGFLGLVLIGEASRTGF